MTTIANGHSTIQRPEPEFLVDDALLAALVSREVV